MSGRIRSMIHSCLRPFGVHSKPQGQSYAGQSRTKRNGKRPAAEMDSNGSDDWVVIGDEEVPQAGADAETGAIGHGNQNSSDDAHILARGASSSAGTPGHIQMTPSGSTTPSDRSRKSTPKRWQRSRSAKRARMHGTRSYSTMEAVSRLYDAQGNLPNDAFNGTSTPGSGSRSSGSRAGTASRGPSRAPPRSVTKTPPVAFGSKYARRANRSLREVFGDSTPVQDSPEQIEPSVLPADASPLDSGTLSQTEIASDHDLRPMPQNLASDKPERVGRKRAGGARRLLASTHKRVKARGSRLTSFGSRFSEKTTGPKTSTSSESRVQGQSEKDPTISNLLSELEGKENRDINTSTSFAPQTHLRGEEEQADEKQGNDDLFASRQTDPVPTVSGFLRALEQQHQPSQETVTTQATAGHPGFGFKPSTISAASIPSVPEDVPSVSTFLTSLKQDQSVAGSPSTGHAPLSPDTGDAAHYRHGLPDTEAVPSLSTFINHLESAPTIPAVSSGST